MFVKKKDEVGIASLKLFEVSVQNACTILIPLLWVHPMQEIHIIFPHSKKDINSYEIPFCNILRKLDQKKCDSNALNIFKKISCALLEAMFSILMILRKHLTTTLRLGLSNLCEYKFKLSFLEAVAQSCSFKRVALGLQIYWNKRLRRRCFPVNFSKFLKTSFFI